MSPTPPVIALEDAIGAQLLMARFGAGPAPVVARRYQVLELRGRGANGVVCRARDIKLNRIVALKVYPRLDDDSIDRETLREAQALARLEHPNVVRIYDHDRGTLEAGDRRLPCLFVSMEFIEGRHLRAWLVESRRSEGELLDMLIAAGDGLAAAHEAGLIHRDFKPENVMIDHKGRVRVVDFGLARGQGPEVSDDGLIDPTLEHQPDLISARLTRPGLAPGTPQYMAPEALDGHASASSDQYSFAAAAWESFTGQLPSERPNSTAESIGRGHLANRLPPRLKTALERGLKPVADERYPSLSDLLDELRWVKRRRQLWMISAGIGAFVGVVLALGWAYRADTLKRAASIEQAAITAREGDPLNLPECDAIIGKWHYDTVVIWASDSVRWHGATGHYELDLEQLGGCAMNASLAKTGDGPRRYADNLVRHGAQGITVVATPRGLELSSTFKIASDKFGKLTYEFNYVFQGDELTGDFQYLGKDGVVWKGIVRGGRTAPTTDLKPELGQASCSSQCRIRCPSSSSRDSCLAGRCVSEFISVPDCGPPTMDQRAPPLTLELLHASASELRRERETDKGREWCRKAAEALPGRWRLMSLDGSVDFELENVGCDLELIDEQTGDRWRGLTTAEGAWVILEPNTEQIRWALIGWDPAFGATRRGTPLAAHKKNW